MTELQVIEAVANELAGRGYRATFEYPGYVEVLTQDLRIDFGPGRHIGEVDTWTGDVESADSAPHTTMPGVMHTTARNEQDDPRVIADALVEAIESGIPEGGYCHLCRTSIPAGDPFVTGKDGDVFCTESCRDEAYEED